ncbi:hypothetical protein LG634_11635 [Streptomyces bambusae]|uniref:DUF6777 domain-containing protein n=1 Tax=Streptomyces bambusae TaxID=1550616 RepID=UPI001CFE3C4F|nr:DUF6777 domain-containing protein [Streptomyces bambusae]MCB5165481.1 hypothetical protein [Streptomyces bambusae]
MHRPVRRYALACTAAAGLLAAAGCGTGADSAPQTEKQAAPGQEVLLQPVVAAGPDPFTASTATSTAALPTAAAGAAGPPGRPGAPALRAVTGSTPGLYGGTHKRGSCDVEQQVRHFDADKERARAFAAAAGVEPARLPDFLRGLTPVVLRADTRVTSHGFRGGRAAAFQAVLQSGTAVLVDEYGLPRVRCSCGNPLMPPSETVAATHKGSPWPGFDPSQVVVVRPTDEVVDNLVIVNIGTNTWLERRAGDDGAQDKVPAVPPPYPAGGPVPVGAAPGRATAPASDTEPCTPSNSLARTADPQAPGRRPAPCPAGDTGPDRQDPPGDGADVPDAPDVPDADRPGGSGLADSGATAPEGAYQDPYDDGYSYDDGYDDGYDSGHDGSRDPDDLPDAYESDAYDSDAYDSDRYDGDAYGSDPDDSDAYDSGRYDSEPYGPDPYERAARGADALETA